MADVLCSTINNFDVDLGTDTIQRIVNQPRPSTASGAGKFDDIFGSMSFISALLRLKMKSNLFFERFATKIVDTGRYRQNKKSCHVKIFVYFFFDQRTRRTFDLVLTITNSFDHLLLHLKIKLNQAFFHRYALLSIRFLRHRERKTRMTAIGSD